MVEKSVYMDTEVFTNIVDDIRNAASNCVLSESPLDKRDAWEGTECGRQLNDILELAYKMSDIYIHETVESLPRALMTLRDSLIDQDRILSEGLAVEKNNGGRLDGAKK